jgi:hypothetical protein
MSESASSDVAGGEPYVLARKADKFVTMRLTLSAKMRSRQI